MKEYFKLITQSTDISIVSLHNCKYCDEEFALYDLEKEILDKHQFKYPDICPTCRFRILYSYINDKHLYHRADTSTGKNIISILNPDFPWKVIDAKVYKNLMIDDEALIYARGLSDDIFWDFKKLFRDFPQSSRMTYPSLENSLYASHVWWAKNLYLSFCVFEKCEDIYYSYRILGNCKTIFNSLDVSESSEIYTSRMVENSHGIYFSSNVSESNTLLFCYNMQGCSDCILSCNKINTKYSIWNKVYKEEEYKKKEKEIQETIKTPKWYKIIEKQYRDFLKKNLVEPSLNIQNSEAIAWDNIYYSSNNINSFKGIGNHNTVNTVLTGNNRKDTMIQLINSIEWWQHCENVIGSCSFGQGVYNLFFCNTVTQSKDCYYCFDIEDCEECMFSIWLRHKKYCILNKQYKKDQYFELKEKMILYLKKRWEWGRFLWFDFSPFPYNDTSSYEFWKVKEVIYADGRKETIDKNARWIVTVESDDFISNATLNLWGREKINIKWRTKNKEVNVPNGMEKVKDLENIDIISEDILEMAIICEKTKRPYRIIGIELEFLKKKGLPIPHIHHEIRMEKLLWERPLWELYVRKCDACEKDMLSVLKRKVEYKIYCPECYNTYMYK